MPLTLACYCEDDDTVSICNLTGLTLMLDVITGPTFGVFTLDGGPDTITESSEGHHEIALTPLEDWIAAWNSLTVQVEAARSLFMVNIPETFSVKFSIRGRWDCYRGDTLMSTHYEYYTNQPLEQAHCECIVDGDLYSFGYGGDGLIGETVVTSTPLGECSGCTVISNWDSPPPDTTTRVDLETSGPLCLCAEGGVPPYRYYAGPISCGQSLNNIGCIEGTYTPNCTTKDDNVTFAVADSAGSTATVLCNVKRGCPPCVDGLDNVTH